MEQEYSLNDPNLYAIFESHYGLPEGILYAQAKQESAFNPKARSPVGAKGLMQFMDGTAKQYGVNPHDPVQSIEGAARMMSDLLNKYSGDTTKALAGYNWGQGNVDRKGVERLPMETSKYIASIEKTLADLKAQKQAANAENSGGNAQIQGGQPSNMVGEAPHNPEEELQKALKILEEDKGQNVNIDNLTMPDNLSEEQQVEYQKAMQILEEDAQAASAQPQQQESSFLDQAGRGVGLAARSLSSGVAGLPLMVGDALNAGINLGTSGINAALGTEIPQLGRASESFSQVQDMAGLPTPQNGVERMAGTVGEFLGGAATGIGGGSLAARSANPVARGVGETLAAQPVMQGVSAVTGGLAAGGAGEMGLPPVVQGAAGLIGGSLPYAFPMAASIPTAGGVSSQQAQRNIADFETAGISPSLGQATEAFPARGIESGLSITPGGAGVIYRKGEALAEGLGEKTKALADDLSNVSTREKAGSSIKEGIEEKFIPKFRAKQKALYDRFETKVPKSTPAPVANTEKTLNSILYPEKGAKKTFDAISSPFIQKVRAALSEDTGGTPPTESSILDSYGQPFQKPGKEGTGAIPFKALRAVRTMVGEKMLDFSLTPDVPKVELKRLYGALTADMEAVAKSQGADAYADWKRANKYTAAFHKRIDNVIDPILKKTSPEDIYNAALSGTKDGASEIRALMRSLPKESKQAVSSNVLREMGKSINSKQDEASSLFSPETFLTNWNKLHPQAKEVLFDNYGDTFKHDLNAIARVTSNLRKGANIYRNPSGTAGAAANAAGIGVILSFLASGNVVGAAKTAGVFGSANLLARAMTNPTAVRWIVMQSKKPKFSPSSALNNLREMAKRKDDAEASSIADELQQEKKQDYIPRKTLDLGTIYPQQ